MFDWKQLIYLIAFLAAGHETSSRERNSFTLLSIFILLLTSHDLWLAIFFYTPCKRFVSLDKSIFQCTFYGSLEKMLTNQYLYMLS